MVPAREIVTRKPRPPGRGGGAPPCSLPSSERQRGVRRARPARRLPRAARTTSDLICGRCVARPRPRFSPRAAAPGGSARPSRARVAALGAGRRERGADHRAGCARFADPAPAALKETPTSCAGCFANAAHEVGNIATLDEHRLSRPSRAATHPLRPYAALRLARAHLARNPNPRGALRRDRSRVPGAGDGPRG